MPDIQFCKLCEKKHYFCDSCHIGIGKEHHIENYMKKVGDYILCGSCYGKLRKNGQIKLDPRGKTIPYLLLNGTAREEPKGEQ